MVKAQMKIQQMVFMILAVFIFFILVGLFFLAIQLKDVGKNAEILNKNQAISSLEVLANMPEFNYKSEWSMSLDEDKLKILSGNFSKDYEAFWPVSSIRVYKIYPVFEEPIKCPGNNCNYYEIYNSKESTNNTYSTFVSLCSKTKEFDSDYDRCEVAKIEVGV